MQPEPPALPAAPEVWQRCGSGQCAGPAPCLIPSWRDEPASHQEDIRPHRLGAVLRGASRAQAAAVWGRGASGMSLRPAPAARRRRLRPHPLRRPAGRPALLHRPGHSGQRRLAGARRGRAGGLRLPRRGRRPQRLRGGGGRRAAAGPAEGQSRPCCSAEPGISLLRAGWRPLLPWGPCHPRRNAPPPLVPLRRGWAPRPCAPRLGSTRRRSTRWPSMPAPPGSRRRTTRGRCS